jgi:TonB-dependent SusC/RagA subfamily outer membrane receptor
LLPPFWVGCASRANGPPPGEIGPGDHGETEVQASTVEAEDTETQRVQTLSDMLSRTPAVLVEERGGDLRVRLRGNNSFLAGQDPLAVIDGMVYKGALVAINPYAIDHITVLKNADETAPYGARGANGVIRIRTKCGGP